MEPLLYTSAVFLYSSHSPLAVSVHLGALLEELQRVHKLEVLWDTPFRRGQQTQGRHVAQLPR